jgi:hypothetical protein
VADSHVSGLGGVCLIDENVKDEYYFACTLCKFTCDHITIQDIALNIKQLHEKTTRTMQVEICTG